MKIHSKNIKTILLIVFLTITSVSFSQELKVKDCYEDDSLNLNFCLAADSLTFDEKFGDSYRVFVVSKSEKNDSILNKIYLKINRSPDFKYLLNADFYEEFKILIIKGVASFYIYSPLENSISDNIIPDYEGCEFSDGQGSFIEILGMAKGEMVLEINIADCGKRKFDLTNLNNIREL